jgi:hypothetical protein
MMDKRGTVGRRCAFCTKDALPGTDPPMCAEHSKLDKKASKAPKTLAELDATAPKEQTKSGD